MMLNLFLSLSLFSHLGSQVHEMNVGLNPVLNSNLALYINEEKECKSVLSASLVHTTYNPFAVTPQTTLK